MRNAAFCIAMIAVGILACADATPDTGTQSQAQPASAGDTARASTVLVTDEPPGIRLFALDSFPSLPTNVRAQLSQRGCSVPQAYHSLDPHNVISGEFAAPGQTDWAALCAQGDSAAIVVVWGGPTRCDTPVEGMEISNWRAIGGASMEYILEHAREFNGPAPPAKDHAGINNIYVGKASEVLFCHQGKWVKLQGAD